MIREAVYWIEDSEAPLWKKCYDFCEENWKIATKNGGVLIANTKASKAGIWIDKNISPVSILHALPFCTGYWSWRPRFTLKKIVNAFNNLNFTNEEIKTIQEMHQNPENASNVIAQANQSYKIFELTRR